MFACLLLLTGTPAKTALEYESTNSADELVCPGMTGENFVTAPNYELVSTTCTRSEAGLEACARSCLALNNCKAFSYSPGGNGQFGIQSGYCRKCGGRVEVRPSRRSDLATCYKGGAAIVKSRGQKKTSALARLAYELAMKGTDQGSSSHGSADGHRELRELEAPKRGDLPGSDPRTWGPYGYDDSPSGPNLKAASGRVGHSKSGTWRNAQWRTELVETVERARYLLDNRPARGDEEDAGAAPDEEDGGAKETKKKGKTAWFWIGISVALCVGLPVTGICIWWFLLAGITCCCANK